MPYASNFIKMALTAKAVWGQFLLAIADLTSSADGK